MLFLVCAEITSRIHIAKERRRGLVVLRVFPQECKTRSAKSFEQVGGRPETVARKN